MQAPVAGRRRRRAVADRLSSYPGNIMGTVFPLFTQQMYDSLTYHWGTALFGFIAVLMIPIPFVRLLHMESPPPSPDHLRARSPGLVLEGACHPRSQQVRVAGHPQAMIMIHTAVNYVPQKWKCYYVVIMIRVTFQTRTLDHTILAPSLLQQSPRHQPVRLCASSPGQVYGLRASPSTSNLLVSSGDT